MYRLPPLHPLRLPAPSGPVSRRVCARVLALVLALAWAPGTSAAGPVAEDKAREELERQLRQLVHSPPPEVVLSFLPLAPPEGYKLLEADFVLDGQPLAVPAPEDLRGEGPQRLAVLTLEEGTHTLVSRVTYVNDSWSLFSATSGYLWKMTATVSFQAQRGLRVRVKVVPGVVPDAPDPRLKLKLTHDVDAEMTAPLADTPPPPVPAPDAGTPGPVARGEGAVGEAEEAQAPSAARLMLQVTARGRPVDAMVRVRGEEGAPREVSLRRPLRKPELVEVAPGAYTLEVVARGFLAQTRRVRLYGGAESKQGFRLVRAPAKRGQQARVKDGRVLLPRPPRFGSRRAKPLQGSAAGVALLVDALVREGAARLRIEGHTDSREGNAQARQRLSEERARALAELLVRAGVDPARIETVGYADGRPRAPNLTPRGRQLNRRVDFVLVR